MLYDFWQATNSVLQVEGIVEGFTIKCKATRSEKEPCSAFAVQRENKSKK